MVNRVNPDIKIENESIKQNINPISKKKNLKKIAERSRKLKQLIQVGRVLLLPQLGVLLESTSSPHYEREGKCKNYH